MRICKSQYKVEYLAIIVVPAQNTNQSLLFYCKRKYNFKGNKNAITAQ